MKYTKEEITTAAGYTAIGETLLNDLFQKIEELRLERQQNNGKPPVIRSGRWKCMLCGRDKFTHKSPHKCLGGFRKRKIIWQEVESHCV